MNWKGVELYSPKIKSKIGWVILPTIKIENKKLRSKKGWVILPTNELKRGWVTLPTNELKRKVELYSLQMNQKELNHSPKK